MLDLTKKCTSETREQFQTMWNTEKVVQTPASTPSSISANVSSEKSYVKAAAIYNSWNYFKVFCEIVEVDSNHKIGKKSTRRPKYCVWKHGVQKKVRREVHCHSINFLSIQFRIFLPLVFSWNQFGPQKLELWQF